MYELTRSLAQTITFVMIDITGTEVAGLGGGFTLNLSKAGGAFNPSTGAKAEIGNGWYSYALSAAETNTVGPLSIRVTGAGAIQQNLLYVVKSYQVGAIEFTYTLTSTAPPFAPIDGAEIWVTTDVAGLNVVWHGETDTFGVARDDDGALPMLDPGTYAFWARKAGFTFAAPDLEIVS